jgi:hypothetical protein
MTIGLWVVAGAACVAAILLWRRTRRLAAQLEQLSHRYWELKYEQMELRQHLQRPASAPPDEAVEPPRATVAREAFVSLASLKR